ncbi:hypothetical protein [uncultured Devosia sp.]|uniref:hypothetical protein n=1 Tax=uncultured Devosia sp. TaxID=211434 RepID=UPI002604EC70|nr:hypothetical protein [uncultured Devosia sp.]
MNGAATSRFDAFVDGCRVGEADFRLFEDAEPTAYARCFGVFALWLTRRRPVLLQSRDAFVEALVGAVVARRGEDNAPPSDKGYRQLLTLTLSALAILGAANDRRIAALVAEQVPTNLAAELEQLGCLAGKPQSGNQAMFLAIFMLYAEQFLGADNKSDLAQWWQLHEQNMNRFGFWGPDTGPTHLHFQNGYHQYEIMEYLDVANPRQSEARSAVRAVADYQGHYAPYPGGGGCFDYDAVFILTADGRVPDAATGALLRGTEATIRSEQQVNGGFCESLHVRPRLTNLHRFAGRLASARNWALFNERLRAGISVCRPKNDRVITHWSRTHRGWGQANLWDSYFRMLLLARIECAFDPMLTTQWGFIDFPGIGWHPSLRKTAGQLATNIAAPAAAGSGAHL